MLQQSILISDIPQTRLRTTALILVCYCAWVHVSAAITKINSTTNQIKDGGIARVIREAQMKYSTTKLDASRNSRPFLMKNLRAKLCKEHKQGKTGTSSDVTETLSNIKTRIVGGQTAQPHEFPHQVLFINGRGRPWCGGTIYNEFYIISAAHCFTLEEARLTPIVGAHEVKTKDGNEQVLSIKSTKLHENFSTQNYYNDIALIQLKFPIKFSEFVQPAQLPTTITERSGSATVTGWGVLKYRGSHPGVLQKVSVPLVTNKKCKEAYSDLIETQLCAGFVGVGGKDACQGDSGGPLSVKNSDGSYTLIGIVSTGDDCASPIYPGVYTDVSQYTEWIKKNAV